MAALAIGGFFGLCNGLLTAYLKLPSLVVTMAMANIVQGIVNAYVSKVAIEGQRRPGPPSGWQRNLPACSPTS